MINHNPMKAPRIIPALAAAAALSLTIGCSKSAERVEEEIIEQREDLNATLVTSPPISMDEIRDFLTYLSGLSPEAEPKLNDPIFLDGLRALQEGGVPLTFELAETLSLSQANNTKYLKALIGLNEAGVDISREGFLNKFHLSDSEDEKYVDSLIELAKAGCVIDSMFLHHLDSSTTTRWYEEYIDNLVSLQKAGVKVDGDFLREFKPPYATDNEITSYLIELHTDGVKIDWRIVDRIDFDQLKEKKYRKAIVELSETGIDLSYRHAIRISLNDIGNPKYRKNLVRLQKAGVDVENLHLPLEKGENNRYITHLIDLHNSGIEINNFSDVTEGLDLEKGTDKKYIKALVRLHNLGVRVDGYLVKAFTIEQAHNNIYMDALTTLSEAGIGIDFLVRKPVNPDIRTGGIIERVGLTQEKSQSTVYIQGLIKLHSAGVDITAGVVDALTLEKVNDDDYMDVLITLSESGVPVNDLMVKDLDIGRAMDRRYIRSLITLAQGKQRQRPSEKEERVAEDDESGEELLQVPVEKKENPEYMAAIDRLSAAGVLINNKLVEYLSVENALDTEYISALIEWNKGVRVDFVISELTADKAKDAKYRQVIIPFMNGADLPGDKAFLVAIISRGEAQNRAYMAAVERSHVCGARACSYAGIPDIQSFSSEKATRLKK